MAEMQVITRKPTHPGEILREEFLPDYELTIAQLAKKLGVSRQSVYELVREHRAVSPDMALRLGKLFGTTPQYWMNFQRNYDLWEALDLKRDAIDAIEPLPVPAAMA